ncbi:MAG: DNA repair protein RecO [Clostridia bacterium]|nr:DNA repair protein RecO [Clostridia bacterium]
MLYTVDGLVLQAKNYGENDKLVTILTADGKQTLIAKGVRSMKSKYKNITEPFVYANFELNQKGSAIAWIKGGSSIEIFYNLREDVGKLFLATYVCDVANELSGERVECKDMLRLTLNTLYAIMNDLRPLSQIKAVFEMRAAAISGYCPNLDYCEECENENAELTYFDITNGALICSECLNRRGQIVKKNLSLAYDDIRERNVLIPLTPASRSAIRFSIGAPAEKIFSFSLSEAEDLKTFSKACEEYLLYHLGHGFDSLDLYHSIL